MSTDVILPPLSASAPRVTRLPAGSASVEGQLLLKKRNALRGVHTQETGKTSRQAWQTLQQDPSDKKAESGRVSPPLRSNGIRRKSPRRERKATDQSHQAMSSGSASFDYSPFPSSPSTSRPSLDEGSLLKSPVSRSSKQRRSIKDTLYHLIRSPASPSEESSMRHQTSLPALGGSYHPTPSPPPKEKVDKGTKSKSAGSESPTAKPSRIFSTKLKKSNSFSASRVRLIRRKDTESMMSMEKEDIATNHPGDSGKSDLPRQPEITISQPSNNKSHVLSKQPGLDVPDSTMPNGKPPIKPKPSRPVKRSVSERTPSRLIVVRQSVGGRSKCSTSSRTGMSSSSSDDSSSDESPQRKNPCANASKKENWTRRRQGAIAVSPDDSDAAYSENDFLNASNSDVCGLEDDCAVTEGPVLFQEWRVIKTDQLAGSPTPNNQPVFRKDQHNKHEKALQRMNSSLRSSIRKKRDWNAMRWINEPTVVSSSIVKSLSPEQIQLQERYFEVLTSERSYNESLKVFVNHFMGSDAFTPGQPGAVIDASTRKRLMSNASTLLELSSRFLGELEGELTTKITLGRVPAIVLDYVENHFQPFVGYCRNQEYQNRICEQQQEANAAFKEALAKLQRQPAARRLPFVSFLLLPMQRVTRMPILLKGINEASSKTDGIPNEQRVLLDKACAAVKKFVVKCDNEAEYMRSMEETIKIKTQLDFGRLKPCQLIVESRQLLCSLEMTWQSDDRKASRTEVKLHIFTDLVLLARPSKKGRASSMFKAVDYCLKSILIVDDDPSVSSFAFASASSGRLYRSSSEPGVNKLNISQQLSAAENLYIRITMLENAEKTKTSYLLEAKSITDKTRCLKTLPQPDKSVEEDDERVYEDWDCPEVVVLHEYLSSKPDVLSLVPGDHIRILRKMPDGWCHGKLVHSDQEGWFHSTYVKEKTTEHTRLRTLKAQHRLLEALSDVKMHKQYSS